MSLATFFRRPEGFVVATVTFTSPVSCALKLIFHLPQHSQLVQAFVAAPQVVISPSPLDAEETSMHPGGSPSPARTPAASSGRRSTWSRVWAQEITRRDKSHYP